jgi:hypothetical protein
MTMPYLFSLIHLILPYLCVSIPFYCLSRSLFLSVSVHLFSASCPLLIDLVISSFQFCIRCIASFVSVPLSLSLFLSYLRRRWRRRLTAEQLRVQQQSRLGNTRCVARGGGCNFHIYVREKTSPTRKTMPSCVREGNLLSQTFQKAC